MASSTSWDSSRRCRASEAWVWPGPTGTLPQGPHELVERDQLAGDRGGQLRDPQRGEVVRFDAPVELVPRDVPDPLVGQSQVVEHGDRSVGDATRPRA